MIEKELKEEEHPAPQHPAPEPRAPAPAVKRPVTPEELRAAWIKLEGYHPLTEQALGEVLQAFLDGRG